MKRTWVPDGIVELLDGFPATQDSMCSHRLSHFKKARFIHGKNRPDFSERLSWSKSPKAGIGSWLHHG